MFLDRKEMTGQAVVEGDNFGQKAGEFVVGDNMKN